MGYKKALSTAVKERLIRWYIHDRQFPVSIEQLIDMTDSMLKTFHEPDGEEDLSLRMFVSAELYKRHHPKKAT